MEHSKDGMDCPPSGVFFMKKCYQCGVCCTATDIACLQKPPATRCPHLADDNRCSIYETRPQVCRDYTPWELCDEIQKAPPEEKIRTFLKAFNKEQYLIPPPKKE